MSGALRIAAPVRRALGEGRPVVALESTAFAHGLPPPVGLRVAGEMADAVRAADAEPAVVGVVRGRPVVGMTEGEVARFAREGGAIAKAGARDLPLAMAFGEDAATTVAATMTLARRAGIRVFATGGIGGVHRGAETSFDVSADLGVLARIPMLVVCSGAKAILDLPKTAELLETLGVPVLAYGQDRLPAFHARDGGLDALRRIDSPEEAAAVFDASLRLGLPNAVVVANPAPEEDALPLPEIEAWLSGAGAVRPGKDATPDLLARLAEASDGATVRANRALLVANAALAGRIAAALPAPPGG